MKTFYFKVSPNNVITDAIDYPYEGYVEVQLPDIQLPAGINGGWWNLVNGELVEIVELNPNTIVNQIQSAIDEYTLELINGGII